MGSGLRAVENLWYGFTGSLSTYHPHVATPPSNNRELQTALRHVFCLECSMPYTALSTALLALIWTQVVHSNLDNHKNAARIQIKAEDVFKRYDIRQPGEMWKLVKDPLSSDIYAGGPNGLYNLHQNELKMVKPSISLLTEGTNRTLFICEKIKEKDHKCCFLKPESDQNCFNVAQEVQINEASLLVDRTLFFTMSGDLNAQANLGLYKQSSKTSYIWPQGTTVAQKYVKIITKSTTLDGKLYSFQTVKNSNSDAETPLWISQVSHYCMGDKGGSKSLLQFRWTSMLSARLFCGKKENRTTFTELLDVAELEISGNTIIFALFKNVYNIRAVCVYKMSEIERIFNSAKFKDPKDSISQNPGECVSNSQSLHATVLKFMEQRPEMEEWILPESDPLVFRHHLYSHLQVDNVNNKDVLLMTLENGRIHKVLKEENGHFIIAEYLPFDKKTHIHSMLLDRSEKMLYVSNSSQVVTINLRDCNHYGDAFNACGMANDPYCSCKNSSGASAEGVRSEDHFFSADAGGPSIQRLSSSPSSPDLIPRHSKYYLTCPTLSKHASYTWIRDNKTVSECVSTEEQCLLLIESMSKKDEGCYVCQATEQEQSWTVTSNLLVENGASHLRVAPAVMTCLLLLISMIVF
ncbi:semaphorin-7A-like isoform X1 [Astyanax mexicanus]|uniref:Semaphorin-7A-like isoform X1 n=2 Tax=Astyanax mexicanus TaxID=7994 RepID=A0A8T2LX83_ASTMX|nr:semaphorin-7A-like isoform X1 [Astyanax mexicanus]